MNKNNLKPSQNEIIQSLKPHIPFAFDLFENFKATLAMQVSGNENNCGSFCSINELRFEDMLDQVIYVALRDEIICTPYFIKECILDSDLLMSAMLNRGTGVTQFKGEKDYLFSSNPSATL